MNADKIHKYFDKALSISTHLFSVLAAFWIGNYAEIPMVEWSGKILIGPTLAKVLIISALVSMASFMVSFIGTGFLAGYANRKRGGLPKREGLE